MCITCGVMAVIPKVSSRMRRLLLVVVLATVGLTLALNLQPTATLAAEVGEGRCFATVEVEINPGGVAIASHRGGSVH
jgi:uncharacterized membrane protein